MSEHAQPTNQPTNQPTQPIPPNAQGIVFPSRLVRASAVKTTHREDVNGLSVVRACKTDWRVTSSTNPDEVLGYIERQSVGRFDVMWMIDPMR